MGKWSNLTALQKATIIQMAASNGESNLNKIIDIYNAAAEDSLENYDYDMAAARAVGISADGDNHYPDVFKKPNHATFSDESMYHSDSTPGGHWYKTSSGDVYVPSEYVINRQGSWNNFLRGFYNQERGKVSSPVYNGGVMLPEVTVTPNRMQKFRDGGKLVHLHEGKTSDSNLHTVENPIPTVNDFITQKLDSIRNDALQRARNTTETVDVKVYDPYAKEHRERLLDDLRYHAQNKVDNYPDYTQYYNNMYNFYNGNVQMASEALHRYLLETDKLYAEIYGEYENAIKNGDYRSAYNCIGNLSRFYPHGLPTGNMTFAANPSKYGFKKIDNQKVQPGDLVQHITYGGDPIHALMYNGKTDGVPTFNYSNGDLPVYDDESGIWHGGWGANKYFPYVLNEECDELNPNLTNVYTYVGTPQDSVQWVNEWMQKYGQPLVPQAVDTIKALGGHLHEPTITDDSQSSYLDTQNQNQSVINTYGFWDNVPQKPLTVQDILEAEQRLKDAKKIEREKTKAHLEAEYAKTDEDNIKRAFGIVEENPSLESVFTPQDIPILGDALQGVEAVDALMNGEYAKAGFLGGMLLMPNILEKGLKYSGLKHTFKNFNEVINLLSSKENRKIFTQMLLDKKKRSDGLVAIGNLDATGNPLVFLSDYLDNNNIRNMLSFILENGVTVNNNNAKKFQRFLFPAETSIIDNRSLQEAFNDRYATIIVSNLGFFPNVNPAINSFPFRGMPGLAMGDKRDVDLFFSLKDEQGPFFERIDLSSTPWANHAPFQTLQDPVMPWTSKHPLSGLYKTPFSELKLDFDGLTPIGISGGIQNTANARQKVLGLDGRLANVLDEHGSAYLPTGFGYNAAGHPSMLLGDGNGIYYISDADAYDFGPSYVTKWVDDKVPSPLAKVIADMVPHNTTPLYIGMPRRINDAPSKQLDNAIDEILNEGFFVRPKAIGGSLKSTRGPLYPFSFEKNPYLKTPVVRYDNGGELSYKYGFGDFLSKLFARTYDGDFNTAFANARADGRNYFKWNGNRYNTQLRYEKYREEHPEEFVPEFAYTDAINRIVREENQKLSKNGYIAELDAWQPHKSVEGGAETVAYGLKLDSHNQAVLDELEKNKTKKYPKGYISNEFALQQSAKLLKDEYEPLAKKYWNSTFKDDSWDKLTPKAKSIILDYQYNVNGGIKTFPKLMKAIHDVDYKGIKANYKRYTGGKELGRNKGILKELEGLFNGDYTVYLGNL